MNGALVAIVALTVGCSDTTPVIKSYDAGRLRTVPEPSTVVEALDHEIHSDGIGPYLLGASLRDVLARLPRGPRVELLQIEGIADYSLVRAERERVLIGVEKPAGVTFVTVVDRDIARTEKDVGVGSSRGLVTERHGELFESRSFASDPRVGRLASMPGVRFVFGRSDDVEAVVVAAEPLVDESSPRGCKTDALKEREVEIRRRAGIERGHVTYGCFTGTTAEALVAGGKRIVVVRDGEELRKVASTKVPRLVYAAALDVDGDGRDEVFAVRVSSNPRTRTVSADVMRVDNGRFTTIADRPVYKVQTSVSGWFGVDPAEIALLIEAVARGGLITVSGLYVRSSSLRGREVVPLRPVPLVVSGSPRAAPPARRPDAGPAQP